MPFVQMENISHFLRACEMAPLGLPSHDRFLTVDLYDGKDPAQVLQCIAAFSRRANAVNSSRFPYALGGKSKSTMSPQGTGSGAGPRSPAYTTTTNRNRGSSDAPQSPPTINSTTKPNYSGRTSPGKQQSSLARGGLASGGPVSSWSNKADEGKSSPAWNIHQYGYMGGASQGNLGVSFGGRRQLTSKAPEVPNFAEKEKRLKEKIEQEKRDLEERQRHDDAEREAEDERTRQEEERARLEEERKWEEETRRLRQQEEQERRLEEQDKLRREREAAEAEEKQAHQRRMESEAAHAREREAESVKQRSRQRTISDARLNGQFLSQYQAGTAGQARSTAPPPSERTTSESQRIAELERQLQELRAQQAETTAASAPQAQPEPQAPSLPPRTQPATSNEDDWDTSERDYLRNEHVRYSSSNYGDDGYTPPKPPRPEPANPALPARPLPDPQSYQPGTTRTDRYLSSNPAPAPAPARTNRPDDYSTTTEVDLENQRRLQSQNKTKAGGWASKSLLEREMERERERQREWEEGQKVTASAARDMKEGSGPGQTWDVHQYGYTGGDNQNRGGPGLGVGGARRQIIGPRPPP